ncbi:MAG: lipopolysaccharide biosynthesis protein [Lachnospiraceae bacterium]|jgi:O-antigen/teichoic acid export membrane protein|nr:lipopolysaccharide biosynthesis protein [Lachnospiraceae bacterium]
MRVKKAIINIVVGGVGTLFSGVLLFVSRIIFVQFLSDEYLGVSSLLTNILSILSMAELGIGTAIGFSLYEPLAEGDTEKIKSIMHFLKRIYFLIGFVIMAVGIVLLPFLPWLVKGTTDLVDLNLVYMLYVVQSASSYWFWAYKSILLRADQKLYLVNFYQVLINFVVTIVQLVTLAMFRNFLLYSVIGLLSNVLINILVSITVDKVYLFIKDSSYKRLETDEKKHIFKDVFGMALFKVNTTIVNSTDNILISAFIHIKVVALYGNYQTIISGISQIVMQLFAGVTATIGNLFVEESEEKSEFVFRCIQLLCYWFYSFVGIGILVLINPVILIFFGKERTFSADLVFLQVLYFIINGFQRTSFIYRDACGLFWKGKMRPVMTAILNIVISITLVVRIGLAGVILGTILSWLFTTWWYDPVLIYRNVFKKPVRQYFYAYGKAVFVTLLTGTATVWLAVAIPFGGMGGFAVRCIAVMLIPNSGYFLFYHKTEEFGYLKEILLNGCKKVVCKCREKTHRA